ncbi:MAG TPA: ArsR family transcriptional regulator [Vicinamibacterales bacterium]|nr:ArsR family transcriptional regulator [Vicinamibacterales bacterium]
MCPRRLRISQPKASRHLAYLRAAGLVDARRDGLWMHYKLSGLPDPILQSISEMVRHALTHLDTVQKGAGGCGRRPGVCRMPNAECRMPKAES